MPKAVVCRELGPPESLRLETFDAAPLAPGQVRVAIRAAGINFPDILMAAGEYQLKPPLPFTPGVEAAGDVVEVNAAEGVAVGDRVIVKMRHGAYSDEAVATPSQLVKLPSTFDYAEGATFLAGHGTAYHALIDRGRLQPGEVLLVHGAGGGVGLAAVEIGKMLGATVIATASSDEKLAIAKARGADHLIRYDREPFRDAVKRITDGQGADVVFDPVGGEVFENSMRCINWGARLLVIGFTGGIGLAKTNLLMIKGASVLGVRAGEAVRRNPALGEVRIKALTEWAEAGKDPPQRLAPVAAGRLRQGDAAVDRPQGDRARGADDGIVSRHAPRRRGIQYAAAFPFEHKRLWNTGSPAFAGDDVGGVKSPIPQKRNRLFDRYSIPHQPRMRRRDHDVIRHAFEFGVRNRHPSIMRLRQHCPGHWIDRPISGDDANGIIDRWQHCIVHRAPLGAELLSGRSEKGAVGAKILQAIGDFAAAVRRAEHDDAAQAFWLISGNVDPRQ